MVASRPVTEYHGGSAEERGLLRSNKVKRGQDWGQDTSVRGTPPPSYLPISFVSCLVMVHSAMTLSWVSPLMKLGPT